MASVCGHRSRSSRNRAANHRQAGASSATGYQTVNCSSNSVPHRIGCAFGKNPALTPYQIVAELISRNRVQTPKLASQAATWRAGPPTPPWREPSIPGSFVLFHIERLSSDLHDLTDSLFREFHSDNSSKRRHFESIAWSNAWSSSRMRSRSVSDKGAVSSSAL